MPIRRYFQIWVGMMNLPPASFWKSSFIEVYLAVDGFNEFNGGKEKEAPMTSDRMHELMELYPD